MVLGILEAEACLEQRRSPLNPEQIPQGERRTTKDSRETRYPFIKDPLCPGGSVELLPVSCRRSERKAATVHAVRVRERERG
ncbi:hypothetical protein ANTRET_LOCUS9258 [Anthophora retusa]